MAWLVLATLLFIWVSWRYLRGEDLSYLDDPVVPRPQGSPSPAHHEVVASLEQFSAAGKSLRGRARIQAIRDYMDSMSDGRELGSTVRTATVSEPRGEWVLAPQADSKRRLLYIHGGAWIAGSPTSHRSITDRLSRLTGAAVFALDYRLLPEHQRKDGIDDCREAYRWLLGNGPDGRGEADFIAIAGDSAGGNLSLSLSAWVRDRGLRAPDAVIAFSPATDGTLTAPTLRTNIASDPMLGPAFGRLALVPTPLLWWFGWLSHRIRPSHPSVSPLRGDLTGLPPTLVQVSEAEMLYDDARRYVRKAQLAGSPVELQSWPHMVHVWQLFTPELPEAEQAYAAIAEFLQRVARTKETHAA